MKAFDGCRLDSAVSSSFYAVGLKLTMFIMCSVIPRGMLLMLFPMVKYTERSSTIGKYNAKRLIELWSYLETGFLHNSHLGVHGDHVAETIMEALSAAPPGQLRAALQCAPVVSSSAHPLIDPDNYVVLDFLCGCKKQTHLEGSPLTLLAGVTSARPEAILKEVLAVPEPPSSYSYNLGLSREFSRLGKGTISHG